MWGAHSLEKPVTISIMHFNASMRRPQELESCAGIEQQQWRIKAARRQQ
jgi:hypothetical protein